MLAKQAEEPEEVVEYDDEGYPIRKGKESLMEVGCLSGCVLKIVAIETDRFIFCR